MIEFANQLMRRLLWLPEQASTFALKVDVLHYGVIITTILASLGIGGAALYFFFKYRERVPFASTPLVNPSLRFEATVIIVPLMIFLAWAFVGFKDFVWANTTPANTMDVYVTGKKWMWHFAHPDGPNENAVLHVPAGRPVRLLMTSRDVIHSFFIPEFRIKQDVVPGRYSETWFEAKKPGRYNIFCTEFCGTWHSQMLGEVVVLEGKDFDKWLERQRLGQNDRTDASSSEGTSTQFRGDLLSYGRRVASAQGCFKCHTTDGTAHIGPTWVDLYKRPTQLESGETIIADEGYLTESMMEPYRKMVKGYGQVMPSYRGKLAAPDAAALVEYIKSLRSDRLENLNTKEPAYGPLGR